MSEETIIPANWKPVFRMPETGIILLRGYKLVLASFVKPLPRKRCDAGFTNGDNTSRIPEAELSCVKCGFHRPDWQGKTARIIQRDAKQK